MLGWFRLRSAYIALTAMVSLASLGASAVSPHVDDCHDSACLAIPVEHDASDHRMTAPAGAEDDHPLHCLVCHWTRSFRPPISPRFVTAEAAASGIRTHPDLIPVARRAQVAQPPLRSPPPSPAHTS